MLGWVNQQTEIKTARRNINNLRYADDTNLMAESEEEQKSQLIKMKEESEKNWLKTQQWPQDWKRSVFIPIPKKGNTKQCSNYHKIALISQASNVQNSPSQASAIHEA